MPEVLKEKERFEMVFRFIERLAETLKSKIGEDLISVVLYGSYARGQFGPESDVDLLIVANGLSPSSLDRQAFFTRILDEVETPSKQDFTPSRGFPYISAILKTPQEADCISRLYFDMIDEAKIFFDREDFFKSVLQKVKKKLEALGAKRVQVGKMWYWDLKPDYQPGEIFEI
jgi:predicted nucleotidyltransferase